MNVAIAVILPMDRPVTQGGVAFLDQGKFVLTNAKWTIAFDVPMDHFITHLNQLHLQIAHLNGGKAYMQNHETFMRLILHHESTTLAEVVRKLRGEIKDFDWIAPSRKLKRHSKGV